MVLAQHRLATLIVAAALAATTGVFMFALPQTHDLGDGDVRLVLAAPPAGDGWTWPNGTPGFVFGEYDDTWNMSRLRPAELEAARHDARRFGVLPQTLRVLESMRTGIDQRPQVLLAGSNATGRTCLGVQLHRGASRFLCPAQLAHTPAVLVVEAMPKFETGYSMFVNGIVRSDVVRVTVTAAGETYTDMRSGTPVVRRFGPQTVYSSSTPGWWGTFEQSTSQPGPWHAVVKLYGAHGRIATADVRFTNPGERVVLAG